MPVTSDTKINAKIDWLSSTVRQINYPENWNKKRAEMKRGMLGYDVGVKYLDGRIELCSSNRKDMLPHVIFSGKCIDKLCIANGGDTMSVLRAMSKGRASRIDIAVDIKNGTLNIAELRDEFADGNAKTKVKKGLYMEAVGDKGETFYIGSVKSPKRVRVYDKAAEMHLQDTMWTRVEFQLRSRDAARCFDMLIKSDKPYDLIPKIILGFVDFPEISDWVMALGTEGLTPSPGETADSNRLQWLMDTAVKSLANEMLDSGKGYGLLEEFRNKTARVYSQKMGAYK